MPNTEHTEHLELLQSSKLKAADSHSALNAILKAMLPMIAMSLPAIIQSLLADKHGNYRRALIQSRDVLIAANLGDK